MQVYKTTELTELQILKILSLFERIFHKKKSLEFFLQQTLNTPLGYSYHCLFEKDGRVLGNYCIIPYAYRIEGKKCVCGLSIDSMIAPEANAGPFLLADMAEMTLDFAKRDGIDFVFGFPNDNAYAYVKEVLGWQEIGILDFHLIPLTPGMIKKRLSIFNFFRYLSVVFLTLCKTFASSREITFPIEKIDSEIFRKGRYDERHHFVKFPGGEVIYTLYEESFGIVAYIIDITPVSAKNFYSAFLAVAKEVKGEAGMIAYPSNKLPFGNILRFPRRFLQRKLHLVANGMTGTALPDVCKEIRNWKINLSDFDVR